MSEWAVTDDLKSDVSIFPKPPTSTIPAVRACNQASVVMTTVGYVTHTAWEGIMQDCNSLSLASERCSQCGIITRKIIFMYVLRECVATNCTHNANIHSALRANYFRRTTLCYKNNTDTPKTDSLVFGPDRPTQFGFSCHRHSRCSCLTLHNCRHLWLSEQLFKYYIWNTS
jgi:hypothetical protein